MIKFVVKAGIAATAVYYIREQGVWKTSNETVETAKRIRSAVNPYVEEVKAQIPIELPEIPYTENVGQVAQEYWNKGVRATFKFIVKLPDYSREYTTKGINALMGNEDIKNFVNSFSESPKPVSDKPASKE